MTPTERAAEIRIRRIIAERVGPDEFVRMDEDGRLDVGLTAREVAQYAKAADEDAVREDGIGMAVTRIDWRNVSTDFVPPEVIQ